MSPEDKNIVVLTTTQNHVWQSMQEIIPELEQHWVSLSQNATLVNVDTATIQSLTKAVLKAEIVVLIALNGKIAQFARVIRFNLGLDIPFVIHLHNQATIGLWPFRYFGDENFFRKNDLFIGTCLGDERALKLCCPDASFALIPFSLPHLNRGNEIELTPFNGKRFIFVGRISRQKNLHTLFLALSLLPKDTIWHLDVFGTEDELGNPNMELSWPNYLAELKSLISFLKIDTNVTFYGQVKREELYETLKQIPHIFVSPSIHSDENFGMAALRSLAMGSMAILTDWGGHEHFLEHFNSQVLLVDVYSSRLGPWVCPRELSEKLLQSLNSEYSEKMLPDYFSSQSIQREMSLAIASLLPTQDPLGFSPLADAIFERRKGLAQQKGQKVFTGYDDALVAHFFSAYGMGKRAAPIPRGNPLPWITINGNQAIIRDPAKGEFIVAVDELAALGALWSED
jgi:glycosyltransferase involved in cell wall biosynthesis